MNFPKDLWIIANQLMSHKEREVRDIAILVTILLREKFPEETKDQ